MSLDSVPRRIRFVAGVSTTFRPDLAALASQVPSGRAQSVRDCGARGGRRWCIRLVGNSPVQRDEPDFELNW